MSSDHKFSTKKIKRHPAEIPLFIIMLLISLCVWTILLFSSIGLIYAMIIGLFVLFGHVISIAHIRGNAVEINEEQFSEIHNIVVTLSKRLDFKKTPEVYLMQSGGVLNALATKFLRSKLIVLHSELLDACKNNIDAIRMIVGHELGHIKSGHLRWHLLLMPATFIPFLGKAFSRAREYTCDRYGMSMAEVKSDGLLGLTILSVGKKYAPQVSHQLMMKQLKKLNSGWMRIGGWLQSHPPLVLRIYQLSPELRSINKKPSWWSTIKGIVILCSIIGIVVLTTCFAAMSYNYLHHRGFKIDSIAEIFSIHE